MALALAARRRSRGRRRGRRALLGEINVTPFVDVMLVLLIVFMITAPLLTAGIPVNLPKTEARPLPADKTPITISVRADGTVFLQNNAVDAAELVDHLQGLAKEGYTQRIFIRADAGAQYGAVADVMARIAAAGYHNLGLVTDSAHKLPSRAGARSSNSASPHAPDGP